VLFYCFVLAKTLLNNCNSKKCLQLLLITEGFLFMMVGQAEIKLEENFLVMANKGALIFLQCIGIRIKIMENRIPCTDGKFIIPWFNIPCL
jgi:hypothetical protein